MTTDSELAADAAPSPGDTRSAVRWSAGVGKWVAVLFVVAAALGTTAGQGGYFSTSWGWSTVALVLAIEIWLVFSGRTDAGRADVLFLGALGLFVTWVALSTIWSTNQDQTIQEVERVLVLLAGVAAFVILVRRTLVSQITWALVGGMTLVATYGLGTRLLPQHLGSYDPVAVYRLSEPLGYWNGLGIFCAMGTLLAVGLAVDDRSSVVPRAIAGIALVVLPVTLYFTFSRGGVGGLAAGALIAALVSDRRLRLGATAAVILPIPAAAVLLASRSEALTHRLSRVSDVSDEGQSMALKLGALALVEIIIVIGLGVVAKRIVLSPQVRRATGVVVLLVFAAALVAGLVRTGNPATRVENAYRAFTAPSEADDPVDLNNRLISFAGNGRIELWRYAWDTWRANPMLGTGAGSFERRWQLNPNPPFKVRDAHALYLETLTELGPAGLLLLGIALLVPLIAGIAARRQALTPYLAGAYGGFLVHAGIDWDWELGGVALTALLIGVLMLASMRNDVRLTRDRVRAPAILLAMLVGAVGLVGLLGNRALSAAQTATRDGQYVEAQAEATRARSFMPWSARPWIALGDAQYASGNHADALTSFRRAIDIDDREWSAWIGVAVSAGGAERRSALERAAILFPGSDDRKEIAERLAKSPD